MKDIFQHLNEMKKAPSLISELFPHSAFYLQSLYGKETGNLTTLKGPGKTKKENYQNKVVGQSMAKVTNKIRILFLTDYFRFEGRPFNEEGQLLLDNIIKALSLSSQETAIEVIEKSSSRPNRRLTHNEQIWNQLIDKIYSLQTEYVVALGAFASHFILQKNERLTELRGRLYPRSIQHSRLDLSFKILPLFHPDFLVINPSMKATAWSDLKLILNDSK